MSKDINDVLGLSKPQTNSTSAKNSKSKQIGLIVALIGIALIVISQTQKFIVAHKYNAGYGFTDTDYNEDTTTKNLLLYSGIVGLILGGIVFASGFKTVNNNLPVQKNLTTNVITNDTIEQQLERLSALRQKELITEDEFNNKKAELLSRL